MHGHASSANRPETLRSARTHSQQADPPQPDVSFGAQCERIAFDGFPLFTRNRRPMSDRDGRLIATDVVSAAATSDMPPLYVRRQATSLDSVHIVR
jgi:hypothetical protein